MNQTWGYVKANWLQFKGQVKTKWGRLTDDDLTQLSGDKDQLIGKIQERYQIAKDAATSQVDDWLQSLN